MHILLNFKVTWGVCIISLYKCCHAILFFACTCWSAFLTFISSNCCFVSQNASFHRYHQPPHPYPFLCVQPGWVIWASLLFQLAALLAVIISLFFFEEDSLGFKPPSREFLKKLSALGGEVILKWCYVVFHFSKMVADWWPDRKLSAKTKQIFKRWCFHQGNTDYKEGLWI